MEQDTRLKVIGPNWIEIGRTALPVLGANSRTDLVGKIGIVNENVDYIDDEFGDEFEGDSMMAAKMKSMMPSP